MPVVPVHIPEVTVRIRNRRNERDGDGDADADGDAHRWFRAPSGAVADDVGDDVRLGGGWGAENVVVRLGARVSGRGHRRRAGRQPGGRGGCREGRVGEERIRRALDVPVEPAKSLGEDARVRVWKDGAELVDVAHRAETRAARAQRG